MTDEICETCGGDRVLIGDAVDRRGERTDDEVPCPDCTEDDFDDEECTGERMLYAAVEKLYLRTVEG